MKSNLLIYDIGSTYTKLTALYMDKDIQYMGRAQAPTTIEDIQIGFWEARNNLAAKGIQVDEDCQIFSTSSAAGGLRMVALGYMPKVTAKAAREVAMSAGARVLEILSDRDPAEYKAEVLQEIKPDIILLAGGTDGGDTASVLENAEIIRENGGHAVCVYAGNKEAGRQVYDIITAKGMGCTVVGNVMPTIHELNVKPSREVIHGEFIKQITKAKGLRKLLDMITNHAVIPTPGAVLLGAELLAKGTFKEEGAGSLIVVDLGGATTDIHSVVPEFADMAKEEIGLVVNNEKQPSYRTVEGNLGMRVSATGIVETIGPDAVLEKIGMNDAKASERIMAYCTYLEKNPEYVPSDEEEKRFDIALAASAVEIALKRHAGYLSQEFNPVMGIVPGVPIGRDLRKVQYIIGVGGVFTHSTDEVRREILHLATKNPGISLLPENPEILIDKEYLVYTIGLLAEQFPEETIRYAKDYFNLEHKQNTKFK